MTSRDPNRRSKAKIEDVGGRRREQIIEDPSRARAHTLNRVGQLVYLLNGILIGLIAIRVVLKVVAANPTQPFARFVYGFTQPFTAIFEGLVQNPTFGNGTPLNVLEFTSLFSIVVYLFVAWIIVRLIKIVFASSRPKRIHTYEE
ncbi:MAG: YggT family protein [Anaerolineae bacterium]|jgi:uncharacterized protein YggT (Ycf19 family)|nr:YggT family protein [Anaerolineae bacterium]